MLAVMLAVSLLVMGGVFWLLVVAEDHLENRR